MESVGAGLSLACAIHCLALPIFLSVIPLGFAELLADDRIEFAILGSAVIISLVVLWWGHKTHKESRLFFAIPVALVIFGFAHSLEHPFHGFVMALGGCVLAGAQLLSRRLCHTCSECHH